MGSYKGSAVDFSFGRLRFAVPKSLIFYVYVITVVLLLLAVQCANASSSFAHLGIAEFEAHAKLLVSNVYGLSGLRQISPFHAGGAIPSNPEFLLETLKGHVLDPERLLVGSASNYGLALYNQQMLPGSSLSLDVNQPAYTIPENFAAYDKQALDGKVMLYSAQNLEYINGYYNSDAVTRHLPNIANPKYISINNAFGRPWHANAPYGIHGTGHISVSDPDGRPLANPPSIENGGVFFGEISNRVYGDYQAITDIRALIPGNIARKTHHQYIPGNLKSASIGTVFMGISPDSSNFAVFASVNADGSVSQIHVQDGVDGLIDNVIVAHKDETTAAGTVFRWTPSFALYITDFYADRIAQLHLTTDANVYRVKRVSYIESPLITHPVDIAPVIPEIANPRFSSNTTMAGSSDLYVANQNGSIIRMNEDGKILAKVNVNTGFENSLNGEIKSIATSYDAQTIFIGMEGKDNKDFIVKIPAFDQDGFYPDKKPDSSQLLAFEKKNTDPVQPITPEFGKQLFSKKFGPDDGIRHVYNAHSCVSCHNNPSMGGFSADEKNFARRVSKYNKLTGQFESIASHNFPVARRKDVSTAGKIAKQKAGIPVQANIVSIRMPPSLLNIGRLDEIPDYVLLAQARSKGDGIQGRVNFVDTEEGKKIGRYGWKANHASLKHIVANALATEIGLDNPYTVENQLKGVDPGNGYIVEAIVKYIKNMGGKK